MQSVTWKFDAYGEPGAVLGKVSETLEAPPEGAALLKLLAIGMNRS